MMMACNWEEGLLSAITVRYGEVDRHDKHNSISRRVTAAPKTSQLVQILICIVWLQ